ncbi:MAG: peptide chain release factor 3 [Puniceicoccaceae bacterium]|nr:MAG: peptide chain release factor 3 [Puniceicoccaceae bacterium]
MTTVSIEAIRREHARRRTFAIISHPDAGKTTLTEKFLLYGGALQLAGSVKARKNQRSTASDWMELEKQRGISVSSTVLNFEYKGFAVNLLDTPGHRDFSEDTYRVLTAVDAVIMVLDGAKGIESQTRKLFEVCRERSVPIVTFINKCDRPGKEPLALLDEIEESLQLHAFPVTWPLGMGPTFRGLFDRLENQLHLFERTPGGKFRAPLSVADPTDPKLHNLLDPEVLDTAKDELELLEGAGASLNPEAVLGGDTTPVYFGSAINNFGIELLLDGFLRHAPAPGPKTGREGPVDPLQSAFSGFIFKIQANMDPSHRDKVAFLRVCSGRFSRDMTVRHAQSGRTVRLSFSQKLFGQDRETADEAWPGDILGLAGHAEFGIGDTLTEDPRIEYEGIPAFSPESFAFLHNPDTGAFKRFRSGLEQLLQEKVVQGFSLWRNPAAIALLGAVGPLQFDVVLFRLEAEYRVTARLEPTAWKAARWLPADFSEEAFGALPLPTGAARALDREGRFVLLFPSGWHVDFILEKNPGLKLFLRPPSAQAARV